MVTDIQLESEEEKKTAKGKKDADAESEVVEEKGMSLDCNSMNKFYTCGHQVSILVSISFVRSR